jgi:Family of unknown function (DUF6516)
MSLEEYSHARGEDFHSCGGRVTSHKTFDVADGRMLLIEAAIVLVTRPPHEAVLEVDEVVVVTDDGGEHRERYSYRFIFEGREIFRYDRDPKNHPDMPEHKHVGTRRIQWERVSFREFVNEVWEWINEKRYEVLDREEI